MAQKVTTSLIDDLDGTDAAESLAFALDGKPYEIDLSDDNAGKLRAALAPFVQAARRSGVGKGKVRRAGSSAEDGRAVRAWAREQGIEVAERGRIPATVIEQYNRRTVFASA